MKDKQPARIAVLMAMSLWAENTLAHDGEINISGKIVDKTCTVSADSTQVLVSLGSVASKQFARPGDGTRYEPFSLHLEKCGSTASHVSVTFTGTPDSHDPALLALTQEAGSATGMGIALYDSNKNQIPMMQAEAGTDLVPYEATVTLNFYARYLANGDVVSAGEANAATTFVLNYA
ncbi:fimbrial protein [Rahnella ecdela]|nr:fimbrial protein [Rahnella ecdela]